MEWTEDMIARLEAHWNWRGPDGERMSAQEIGGRLGISKNATVGKVHRLGLAPRQSPIIRGGRLPAPPQPRRAGQGVQTLPPLASIDMPLRAPTPSQSVEADKLPHPDRIAAGARGVRVMPPQLVAQAEPAPPPRPGQPCRWPMWGHHEKPTHRYCNAPGVLGRPYCAEHCRVAWEQPERVARFIAVTDAVALGADRGRVRKVA